MSPYRASAPGISASLRQGELITDVRNTRVLAASLGTEELQFETATSEYALILTQDCDLEQDYAVRFLAPKPGSDKLMPAVLLAVAQPAAAVFASIAENSKKQWDRLNIQKNKNERFHFLQKVGPDTDRLGQQLPELVIDFKRYFTVPTDVLYRRIELGESARRCVLVSPYLEHLSGRFAHYLSRVALPSDHVSE